MKKFIILVIGSLLTYAITCKSKIQFNEKFFCILEETSRKLINKEKSFYNSIKNIYATSTLGSKYLAEKMIDGNLKTCWATSINGGIGEQFLISGWCSPCPYKGEQIMGIIIYNGYCKNRELYYKNNRIKKMKLEIYRIIVYPIDTDNGLIWYTKRDSIQKIYEKQINLHDTFNKEQKIVIEIDLLKDYKKTKHKIGMPIDYLFLFTIEEIYKGTKYNDLCVSEIRFLYKK